MPDKEKILADFDAHISEVDAIAEWVSTLYYDPQFSAVFNRPVLSMMIIGCKYVADNLRMLRVKWQLSK